MNNEFTPHNQKNIELLRFYINRDLCRIENNLQHSRNDLVGFFIASLIDLLIVILFNDMLKPTNALYKIIAIIFLVILFIVISKIANKVADTNAKRKKGSGREEYVVDSARQAIIDAFDNVACDGLLLCESYIDSYCKATESYKKSFYLYEVLHYLTKSANLFQQIYKKQSQYISSEHYEMIDSYRANNYIEYAQTIHEFLKNALPNPMDNADLDRDLQNLNEIVSKWEPIKDSSH